MRAPAGANNYVKWRRSIDEHLELRRLTWHEYAMFSWLCTKASPRTGSVRTSWPTLSEQTGLRANHVEKLCRSLKRKRYVWYPPHRGARGRLVEVAIDKFPTVTGAYTDLSTRFPASPALRGHGSTDSVADLLADRPAHVRAERPAKVSAEGPAEVLADVRASALARSRGSPRGRPRSEERDPDRDRDREARHLRARRALGARADEFLPPEPVTNPPVAIRDVLAHHPLWRKEVP